jgi:hypothetical protein
LSSDSTSTLEDYLAVAIFGNFKYLAFMKLGEESWTYVDKYKQLVFVDVLYFKGQVLAIDYRSGLVSIDVSTNQKNILAPIDLEYTE